MDILVYCAGEWRVSTWLTFAMIRRPMRVLTCPPLTGETFPYKKLAGLNLLYLRLHGMPEQSHLYGSKWQTAFSLEELMAEAPDMSGSVVFMEGCYGRRTQFPKAFKSLGAEHVIGSNDETESENIFVGQSSRFGQWFVRAFVKGKSAQASLAIAKRKSPKDVSDKFEIV